MCKCDVCSFLNYCSNMDFESVNKKIMLSNINESYAILTVTAQFNTISFVKK